MVTIFSCYVCNILLNGHQEIQDIIWEIHLLLFLLSRVIVVNYFSFVWNLSTSVEFSLPHSYQQNISGTTAYCSCFIIIITLFQHEHTHYTNKPEMSIAVENLPLLCRDLWKKATAPLPRRFSQKDIATATTPLPRWLFQKPAAAAPPWTSLNHRFIKLLLSSLQNSSCSWRWFKKLTDCKLFDLTIVDWHLVIVYFCMMIVKYFIRILRLTLTCLTSWLLSNHY